MLVITPERLLERSHTNTPRSFAILIYKKLQAQIDQRAEIASTFLDAFTPDIYRMSFHSEKDADLIMAQVKSRVEMVLKAKEKVGDQKFFCLPPLFLMSSDRFIVCYDEVLLVGTPEGPIVPVVELQVLKDRSILQQLMTLYELCSPNFVDIDSLHALLQPAVESGE